MVQRWRRRAAVPLVTALTRRLSVAWGVPRAQLLPEMSAHLPTNCLTLPPLA
jgi:hypothetical protein